MVKESTHNTDLLTVIFISKICNTTENHFQPISAFIQDLFGSTNLMVERTLKTCSRKIFKKIETEV